MRITLDDRFDAPPDEVADAVLQSDYQERLVDLPNVASRDVTLFEERSGGSVHRVVRYRYSGDVPGAVRSAIGDATISWDEVGTYDPSHREWRFEIEPHVFQGRFVCHGHYRFRPDGEGTRRQGVVDVHVKVPLVGRKVEEAIGEGLAETLEAEAAILREYLSGRAEAAS